MNFKLKLNFTNKQLDIISKTNSKVIIAKPTSGSTPTVAWQAFYPLNENSLTWDEEYGVYVSTASVSHGAELTKLSSTGTTPVISNKVYTLEPSGIISGPEDGGDAGSFGLTNQYDKRDYMTVGLYQDAIINCIPVKGNAVSAAPLLLASTATITPYTTVYVWLHSEVQSNTVVTKVTSPTSPIKFGGTVVDVTAHYDTKSGLFLVDKAP